MWAKPTIFLSLIIMMAAACSPGGKEQQQTESTTEMNENNITRSEFGKLEDGTTVSLFTLSNSNKMEVQVMNYGATITSIKVPDQAGVVEDVALGFDSFEPYLKGHPFFGSVVGRYGNRIADGKFELDGVSYNLAQNNNGNHLHGGLKGFDKQLWDAEIIETDGVKALQLSYLSQDGEEGYPGNLSVKVFYSLDDENNLKIEYQATTDGKTVVNLTNHSYFNLKGAGDGPILDHVVQLNADKLTEVREGLIPTGKIVSVENTPLDFREPVEIGARIDSDHPQMQLAGGYDHNFVLNQPTGDLNLAARVTEPASGRVMEVFTTEPGVQFYTGNFLDGSLTGKGGIVYEKRYGFCLETQHFPDSPNQPEFASTVLEPGETYNTVTIYHFSTL
jgi:aldose 1-epimerase